MDRDQVVQAKNGDREAFARLAAVSIALMDATARLITLDPERARSAVQAALVRAWRDLPRLEDPDRFDAWLRRQLVRACIDELRHARRRVIQVELTQLSVTAVDDGATALAVRDALERGYRQLEPDERSLIVLVDYLGLSLPDAADAASMPVATASSRFSRARDRLRAALDADVRSDRVLAEGRPA